MVVKQKEEDFIKEEVKEISHAVWKLVPNIIVTEDAPVKKV